MIHKKIVCLSLILSVAVLSHAQNWQMLETGVNNYIRTLYADTSNNILYIGGNFLYADGAQTNYIAKWDGASLDSVGNGLPEAVTSITKYHDTLFACTFYTGIFWWDGANWNPLNDSKCYGIYSDNNFIYAFGLFDSIAGIPASRIAKWDGVNWSAIDTTKWYGGGVSCAQVFNGDLYIGGGDFGNYNATIYRIGRWDGVQWNSVGNGIVGGLNNADCFEVYNNELYVGGRFLISDGNVGNNIMKWNGSQWDNLSGGMNARVFSMKVYNNELYAGGIFATAGGVPAQGIAKWNGSQWCGFGDTISGVTAIGVYSNELYIGSAPTINSDTINYLAKWIGGNYVDTCSTPQGISNVVGNENGILFYPNPVSGNLTIEISDILSEKKQLSIYNLLGEKVLNKNFSSQKYSVDVSQLSAGIYIAEVICGQNLLRSKFIKE